MEDDDEQYALTARGVQTIVEIDTLFRNHPSLTLDEIAQILDLDDADSVRILYGFGVAAGVVDVAQKIREDLGYRDILD